MTAAALELEGISHTYPHAPGPVLTGVSLSLRAGEIVGVGGRSGSGKSTLLRVGAGLLRAGAGQVRMAGEPAWQGRRVRYPRPGYVGMVLQDPVSGLDPRWSVGRAVTEPLLARHRRGEVAGPRGRPDLKAEAIAALRQVGLGGVPLQARPDELSVGQLQRVVLARALLARPAVLLADEPTSALDVTSGAGILHLLRRFADQGAAVLVISHDGGMLGALCDRRYRLAGGRLEPAD